MKLLCEFISNKEDKLIAETELPFSPEIGQSYVIESLDDMTHVLKVEHIEIHISKHREEKMDKISFLRVFCDENN